MNKKKPIFKKRWFWIIVFFALIIVYGAITGINRGVEEAAKQEVAKQEEPEETKEPEEEIIKINNKLAFGNFSADFEQVRYFEENEKDYAEISFIYINQSGEDKKAFMNLANMSITQNDEALDDIDDSWNPINKNGSPLYFPNANSGEYKIKLTYAIDRNKPIEIYVSENETGESEKIVID